MEINNTDAKNKTVAFISSYDEVCGNATYTKQIMEQIKPYFKSVNVIKLNQFLIHANHGRFSGIVLQEVLNQINNYDYINIQWEPGLFSERQKTAFKFIMRIINNFKGQGLSITCHSLDFDPSLLSIKKIIKAKIIKGLCAKKLKKKHPGNYFYQNLLIYKIAKLIDKKKISIIVHTKELYLAIKNTTKIPVFCHPIISPTKNDIEKYNHENIKNIILQKYSLLQKDKIYLGIFGFYGFYKGFDVIIKTIKYLPEKYSLIISSNLHPINNIKIRNVITTNNSKHVKQDEYIEYFNNIILEENEKSLKKTGKGIIDRIHYINHIIDEEDFKALIAGVDIVILPYYEIGQSGSGPTSYATFLNHNGQIILSRTAMFEQYSQNFFPECFTFFDQGNEIELSYKILSIKSKKENILRNQKNYNPETNAKIYFDSLVNI